MSAFTNNVVIITGASSGLGAEMARQLAAQGAKLALAARSAEALEAVAEQCRAAGGEAIAIPTDVSVQEACAVLVEKAVAHYGRLDTLVCNAGLDMHVRIADLADTSIIERILRVNYLGSVYPTLAALPHLRASKGRIVGMNSVAGLTGVPGRTAYSASKAAQVGFFEALRVEEAENGITVTLLHPDYVSTGLHGRAFGADGQPVVHHHVDYDRVMNTETAVRKCIDAMAKRRRMIILSARGKAGRWAKLIVPGLVDAIALRGAESGK